MPKKSTYDWDFLLEIKELLDNGYTNKQIQQYVKPNISPTIISNVRNGLYGPMPTFKSNPDMKRTLSYMNLEIIRNRRGSGRKKITGSNKP